MLVIAALIAIALPTPAPTPRAGSAVVAVLQRLEPQIKRCGTRGRGPTDATLSFTVDPSGAAREVGVDLDDAAAACIIRLVADARFPPGPTPQEVTVPLRLTRRPPSMGCADVDLDMRQPSDTDTRFDKRAVLAAVKRLSPAVRRCADATSPAVASVSWLVDTRGQPVNIVVGAIGETPVGRCIAAQVATMRFPRPDDAVPVSFPFKLR